METELRGAEEERDTLRRDLSSSSSSRDELVRKAWEARDAAVKRKNAAEVELARARIGIMQVGGKEVEGEGGKRDVEIKERGKGRREGLNVGISRDSRMSKMCFEEKKPNGLKSKVLAFAISTV